VVVHFMLTIDKVKLITFELSSYCNLHCPQCNRFNQEGFLNVPLSHLNFINVKKHFQVEKFKNLEEVKFIGNIGDALMHPDIEKYIKYFDKIDRVYITTNGSLRSKKWWRELAKYQNLEVIFSIDGLKDTNKIYRINSNFEKIINNAKAFIDAGGHATWKFIVFKHNEHQIDEAHRLSTDIGFKAFKTEHTSRSWFQGNKWEVKINGEFQYDIEPCSVIAKLKNNLIISPIEKDIDVKINTQVTKENCLQLKNNEFFINCFGHVLPCCMLSEASYQKDIPSLLWQKLMGDIDSIDLNKTTFEDITNNDFYINRLSESLSGNPFTHRRCIICQKNEKICTYK
jgi:hypothetical protein